MNLYKLNAQNKNTNLYTRFYILFIRNQRKTTKKTDYRIITVSDRFHPYLRAVAFSPASHVLVGSKIQGCRGPWNLSG